MSDLPDSERKLATTRFPVRRWLPLAVIVLASVTIFAMGWHRHLSFETLARDYAAIRDFVSANLVAAVAVYVAVYITVIALSIPAGLVLTPTGGILFGGLIGAVGAIVAATVGATILFLVAKTAFGEHLVRRAGPQAEKLAAGFRANAFSYLMFLRLVPVFPFFLVNLVAALVGVGLGTFIAATAIGIIPGAFAFAYIGAGLDHAIRAQSASYHACLAAGGSDCRIDFDIRAAVTPELIAGLVVLGLLALLPVVVKRLRARHANPS